MELLTKEEVIQAICDIGKSMMSNQSDEGTAVKGYTEQLKAIYYLLDNMPTTVEYAEIKAYCESLVASTEEKISDELNHQKELTEEYSKLMGIKIAED